MNLENGASIFGIAWMIFVALTWIYIAHYTIKTPLEKILDDFKKDSKSPKKFLAIPAFLAGGGPFLIILGLIIVVVRFTKTSGPERARLDARFKGLRNKMQEARQQIESGKDPKEITRNVFSSITATSGSKPSAKSMKAAMGPTNPGNQQDHGLGRAVLLVVLILILFGSYYVWKSGIFQQVINLG